MNYHGHLINNGTNALAGAGCERATRLHRVTRCTAIAVTVLIRDRITGRAPAQRPPCAGRCKQQCPIGARSCSFLAGFDPDDRKGCCGGIFDAVFVPSDGRRGFVGRVCVVRLSWRCTAPSTEPRLGPFVARRSTCLLTWSPLSRIGEVKKNDCGLEFWGLRLALHASTLSPQTFPQGTIT